MKLSFFSSLSRLLPLLAIVLGQSSAVASEEFVPLQEFAEGQSLSGSNLLNDSLYSNPAASSFTNVYSVDGTYGPSKSFAASILDTKTSGIGGALGYFRRPIENFDQPLQGIKASLSGRIYQGIGFGIAGKALWGPDYQNQYQKLNDADMGTLANFGILQVGFTVRNLLGGKPEMDQAREFSLGGRIGYKDLMFLSLATQSYWDQPNPYQYGIGVEYVSPYYFSIKGGYRYLPRGSPVVGLQGPASFWSAGFSIVSPVVSVHYAAQFANQGNVGIEHLLGLTVLL